MFRTRFAPSPTGPLHLGHAFSALLASDKATAAQGEFLLRIEDIDQSRARSEWEALIFRDLSWLGLDWPSPVLRQSDQMPKYRRAVETLWNAGLLYVCTCNRRDIVAATSAPQEGGHPLTGPDGIIYPGTCRPETPTRGPCPLNQVLRLNMRRAIDRIGMDVGTNVTFEETGHGPLGETGKIKISAFALLQEIGDIVLARRDMGTSYHLSVVLDDSEQKISHVIRGEDLFEATKIHVMLQHLLGLAQPVYHHHRLIRDTDGKRLAKRDDARALQKFRAEGHTPADIRQLVGL